ncbi:hypothetical protein RIF29_25567 [Crotalaria pallida]|uniref:Uncharacterized protein n=1 Tax=Crotalaria pallida TaxID=3830 RepID=A0AAN9EU17_CROPI
MASMVGIKSEKALIKWYGDDDICDDEGEWVVRLGLDVLEHGNKWCGCLGFGVWQLGWWLLMKMLMEIAMEQRMMDAFNHFFPSFSDHPPSPS